MAGMTSTKPYLFRGIYEWIEDNNMTPHIVVDAVGQGVLVPQDYVDDGQITLNISSGSIELYQLDNQMLHFSARFNGISHELTIPMAFILGIYARENGQGMFFEAEEYPELDIEEKKPMALDKVKSVKSEKAPTQESTKQKDIEQKKLAPKKPKDKKNKGETKRDSSHLKIIK